MADVKVRIIAEDAASPPLDKIGKQAQKTEKAFAGLQSGLVSMAAAFGLTNIIGGAVSALKNAVSTSFNLAVGLEQATIAFTTMLGSGEKASKMLGDLKAFADETPFEFLELQDAAKRMMAYGFAADDVIPILKSVGDAAAALGGGGPMIKRITTALGQMSAKGKVGNDDLRQLAEAGVPALKHLADAAGVTTAAMSKMIERGIIPADQAVKVLTASMSRDFGGLMARQAETAGGKVSTMKDALAGLKTELGKSFIPTVKLAAEGIAQMAKASEGWLATQNQQFAHLSGLTEMVKAGAISFDDYKTVVNEMGAAAQDAFGPMLIVGDMITDHAGAVALLKQGQQKLDDQYAISRTRIHDYMSVVATVVPVLTPAQKAINEHTAALERQKEAFSLVSGVLGDYKKEQTKNVETLKDAQKKVNDLTTAHKKSQAAILAAGDQYVNNTDKLERLRISTGFAAIAADDLNERYANQDNINAYNDGIGDVTDSINELNKKTIDANFTQDDYNKKMEDLTERQGDLKTRLDNSAMSQEEYNLRLADGTLDGREAAAEFAKLTAEHGKGSTAAQIAAGEQGKYNTKLKEAQAELQKQIDKERELRDFVTNAIKTTVIEKEIAALAEDGFSHRDQERVKMLQDAMGLAHDQRITDMLIEQGAGEAMRLLEHSNALDYIKDDKDKAIATAAFIKSVGDDITQGLVPNYAKALKAAQEANKVIADTGSIYNGINDKTVNLTIITTHRSMRFEGMDGATAASDAAAAAGGTQPEARPTAPFSGFLDTQVATSHGNAKAQGGVYSAGGSPFLVGERGAEIIDPSGGGRVYSNTQTMGMMGGGQSTQSLRIGTLNVYGVQDTSSLFTALRKEARARGLSLAA